MSSRSRLVAAVAGLVPVLVAGSVHAFTPRPAAVADDVPLPGNHRPALVELAPTSDARVTEFSARFGGRWSVDWNDVTRTPHAMMGSGTDFVAGGIRSEADARRAATDLVTGAPDLFGANAADLEIVSVVHGLGRWSVHFEQRFAGVPVEGGRVRVAFTDQGRLIFVGSDAYAVANVATTPLVSREDAVRLAAVPLGYDASGDELRDATLVILPAAYDDGVDYRLAWRIGVRIDQPLGNWKVWIDARTGDLIGRTNLIRTATVSGTVKAGVQYFGYCDGTDTLAMPSNRVTVVGQGTALTDAAGNWSVTVPGAGVYTVRDSLRGSFVRVTPYTGAAASFSQSASAGTPLSIMWTDSNSRKDERDVFYNVNLVHDRIKAIDPAFNELDYAMPASVGRTDGYCPGNAWWDGNGVNFCAASATYGNTGEIGNVVYHEWGHGLTQEVYLPSAEPGGDLHEGNSDVIACFTQDVSIVGLGFYLGNCTSGIRNLDNSLRYPQDLSGSGHHDGQIIGGFHWDARELLKVAVGQPAADSVAWNTWHYARKLGLPYDQPDQVLWTFIMDDDDGNLDNGTPHHAQFCEAATNHNFTCPEILTGVLITHTPLATTTDPSRQHVVIAQVASTEAAIAPAASYVAYRVNGGAFSQVPLGYDPGTGTATATIPLQPGGSEIEYYIHAEDVLGNVKSSPATAPAALWAFDIAYHLDNLETATAWTVGAPGDGATTGVWERADPQATAAQPEDDHTPAPGALCYVTQAAAGTSVGSYDIDGGATTLTSPVYALSGASNIVIKYYRWYTNDTGNDPNNDYWDVFISNDGGTSWSAVEHTLVSDHSWKLVRRPLTDFFPTPGNVRLRFVASDLGLGSVVEAGVDDFEILASFGTATSVEATGREPGPAPLAYALGAAAPNPFGPRTVIHYDLPRESPVSLRVFDVTGREVRALVATTQAAGRYGVAWDGRDDAGRVAPSGVYFYRLDAEGFSATRKILMTR